MTKNKYAIFAVLLIISLSIGAMLLAKSKHQNNQGECIESSIAPPGVYNCR